MSHAWLAGLGASFALIGIVLLARKGPDGVASKIKAFGMEFSLGTSALVVFVMGAVMILQAFSGSSTQGGDLEGRDTAPTHPVTVGPEAKPTEIGSGTRGEIRSMEPSSTQPRAVSPPSNASPKPFPPGPAHTAPEWTEDLLSEVMMHLLMLGGGGLSPAEIKEHEDAVRQLLAPQFLIQGYSEQWFREASFDEVDAEATRIGLISRTGPARLVRYRNK